MRICLLFVCVVMFASTQTGTGLTFTSGPTWNETPSSNTTNGAGLTFSNGPTWNGTSSSNTTNGAGLTFSNGSTWNGTSTSSSGNGTPPRGPKTIRVSWTYEDDGGGIPDVTVISHGSTPALTDTPIAVSGTTYQADITGLAWGVPHYWQVTTVNAAGKETPSPLRSNSQ